MHQSSEKSSKSINLSLVKQGNEVENVQDEQWQDEAQREVMELLTRTGKHKDQQQEKRALLD